MWQRGHAIHTHGCHAILTHLSLIPLIRYTWVPFLISKQTNTTALCTEKERTTSLAFSLGNTWKSMPVQNTSWNEHKRASLGPSLHSGMGPNWNVRIKCINNPHMFLPKKKKKTPLNVDIRITQIIRFIYSSPLFLFIARNQTREQKYIRRTCSSASSSSSYNTSIILPDIST